MVVVVVVVVVVVEVVVVVVEVVASSSSRLVVVVVVVVVVAAAAAAAVSFGLTSSWLALCTRHWRSKRFLAYAAIEFKEKKAVKFLKGVCECEAKHLVKCSHVCTVCLSASARFKLPN